MDPATGQLRGSRNLPLVYGFDAGDEIDLEILCARIHADHREIVPEALARAAEEMEPVDFEFMIEFAEGPRWIQNRAVPIRAADGSFNHWIGTAVDITELKSAEDELRRALHIKDEFISFVSHELRTPLTTLVGTSRHLARRADRLDPEQTRQAAEDVHLAALRLNDMLTSLLSLAFAGHQDFVAEPVPLAELVEEIVDRHRDRYRQPRVLLAPVDESLAVLGNQVWIEEILTNLLSNGAKYSPAEEPLELLVTPHEDEVHLVVLDRGPGIAEDDRDRIFEAFYRSQSSMHQAQGAGLGLAVCRRLAELMHGRVWWKPRAGGGSEFCLALMRAASPAEDDAALVDEEPEAAAVQARV
jgi:signal transduction histidine kinase